METVETLRHQRDTLADALFRLLVAQGVLRTDIGMDGPQLLLAVETAIEHLSAQPNPD